MCPKLRSVYCIPGDRYPTFIPFTIGRHLKKPRWVRSQPPAIPPSESGLSSLVRPYNKEISGVEDLEHALSQKVE
jgi:hypothetical protein